MLLPLLLAADGRHTLVTSGTVLCSLTWCGQALIELTGPAKDWYFASCTALRSSSLLVLLPGGAAAAAARRVLKSVSAAALMLLTCTQAVRRDSAQKSIGSGVNAYNTAGHQRLSPCLHSNGTDSVPLAGPWFMWVVASTYLAAQQSPPLSAHQQQPSLLMGAGRGAEGHAAAT